MADATVNLGSKPLISSTTVPLNATLASLGPALMAIFPSLGTFAAAHPSLALAASGVFSAIVNILWRAFVTKQPISGLFTSP